MKPVRMKALESFRGTEGMVHRGLEFETSPQRAGELEQLKLAQRIKAPRRAVKDLGAAPKNKGGRVA